MGCRFAFVILHYNSIDSTRKCIDSIDKLDDSKNAGIVIVDNASPNATGVELEREYADRGNIKVILHPQNVGFAKGNNIGYLYAKRVMKAECIICANNDVYFVQQDFLCHVEQICAKKKTDVLGPDIRTYQDVHQNPLREAKLSLMQFWKKHIIKYGWLAYWHLRGWLPFIRFGEKLGTEATKRYVARRRYQEEQENIVLQGACILFMKEYVQNEDEAFVPDTFMYMEEDILAYKCLIKGYRMSYSPEIYVFHAESLSTMESFSKKVEKELFYYRECLRSDKILHQYIKLQKGRL